MSLSGSSQRIFFPALVAGAALLVAPAAVAQTAVGDDARACNQPSGPALRVHVTGLKDRIGRLKLELYPATEDDFLKDDHDLRAEGKTFRRVFAPTPKSGEVYLCIKAPRAGQYALFLTHDRDGKNKFNFWQDGGGLPSNRRMGRSRPKLADGLVNIGPGVSNISIRMQYLRGIGGFSPLRTPS